MVAYGPTALGVISIGLLAVQSRESSLRNIIGTMGEGSGTGRQNLQKRKHVLCFVIIVSGVCVGLFKVTRKLAVLSLSANNVLLQTTEEGLLEQPEHNYRVIPDSLRPGTAEVDNITIRRTCIIAGARSNVGLFPWIGGRMFTAVFDIARSIGLQFFQGLVAFVEVADGLHMRRARRHFTTAQEKRALDDMPGLELPVAQDDPTVEPGAKENSRDERDTSTNTKHSASNLTTLQVDSAATTLPDDKHYDLSEVWRKGSKGKGQTY